jgi:hypothetical protein
MKLDVPKIMGIPKWGKHGRNIAKSPVVLDCIKSLGEQRSGESLATI